MLARLGFSAVACLGPDILLIDEIMAVGCLEFQKKCTDEMTDFKKRLGTMIFVSHSMPDNMRIYVRGIWIDNHTLKMTGDSENIVASYTLNYSE